MLSTALLLVASMVGQADKPAPSYEHLKTFDGFIGKWVYEGPVQEDVPNLPGKNTPMVVGSSWKRIFNKAVVENEWALKFKDAPKVEGTSLYGWDAADKRIVEGSMDSLGGISVGTVFFSDDGKTLTIKAKTTEGDGTKTSGTIIMTLQNDDTFVWQTTDRQGRDLPPDSPKYTFKRVKRTDDEDKDDDDD